VSRAAGSAGIIGAAVSQPLDSFSELFANLRPRAAEFGAIPALQLTDDPGKFGRAFVSLQQEEDKPGLALLVVHLSPEQQLKFVVELDGLRGLIDRPI